MEQKSVDFSPRMNAVGSRIIERKLRTLVRRGCHDIMVRFYKIKRLSIIIFIAIISGFFGYRFGFSQAGQFLKSIVEPGSMVTEASYVIFTNGVTVYARNGNTGEIVKSSNNASEVIQYTINQLANGGKIFIKVGTYDLGINGLEIPWNYFVTIEGESPPYWWSSKTPSTILKYSGSVFAITTTGAKTGDETNMIFKNFFLDCTNVQANGGGMNLDSVGKGMIENVYVTGNANPNPSQAIVISSSSSGQWILQNIVVNGFRTGFNINTAHVTMIGCEAHKNTIGFDLDNQAIHSTLINPHTESVEKVGFDIDARQVTLINPYIEKITVGGTYSYAIRFTLGSNEIGIVINPKYYDLATGAEKLVISGLIKVIDADIIGNAGYLTENWGTATIIASSTNVTVNHGLISTPKIVTVTPNWLTTFRVYGKTGTSFSVEFGTAAPSGAEIDWYAEV